MLVCCSLLRGWRWNHRSCIVGSSSSFRSKASCCRWITPKSDYSRLQGVLLLSLPSNKTKSIFAYRIQESLTYAKSILFELRVEVKITEDHTLRKVASTSLSSKLLNYHKQFFADMVVRYSATLFVVHLLVTHTLS